MLTCVNAHHSRNRFSKPLLVIAVLLVLVGTVDAQESEESALSAILKEPAPQALTEAEFGKIDSAVDRALLWMSTQQKVDGRFASIPVGQPGVTGLCVLSFLSGGHQPDVGPYGEQITRAIDFVLTCQHKDGLLSQTQQGQGGLHRMRDAALYNHAIGGLMLGEVYGMIDGEQARRTKPAIEQALVFTRQAQLRRPRQPSDAGGWRYLRQEGLSDSDLLVTAWQLQFYRSAKNAEFDVPVKHVDEAVAYVRRCFDDEKDRFVYALYGTDRTISRAVTGAGILSLVMAGEHDGQTVHQAGVWVLDQSFKRYNRGGVGRLDRFHYGAYYCSQAMFQLGDEYWERFYPPLARTLIAHQQPDGSWDPEWNRDGKFGNAYTTSLAVLALTPHYQLLPIFQR